MKLQKRLSRIYQGKKYYKWIITLPPDEVISSEFKEGDNLKIESSKGMIVITKKPKND